MSLLTDSGNTKDDLKLPADETLLKQVGSLFCYRIYLFYINFSFCLRMKQCVLGSLTRITDFEWADQGSFAEGKDMIVSVMSAMGEEHICAVKDIGTSK